MLKWKKHFFNTLEDGLKIELIKILTNNGIPKELLLWPSKAKYESFRMFNTAGKMGLGNIGINRAIEENIKKMQGENDFVFEFMMNSSNIHLANSLEATYFPFSSPDEKYSDSGVSNILGMYLNTFKNPNDNYSELLNNIKDRSDERKSIEFLNLKDGISVLETFEKSKKYETSKHLKEFLLGLEKLDLDKQQEKIRNLNNVIYQFHEGESKIEKGINYALTGAGLISLPISLITLAISSLMSVYKSSDIGEKRKINMILEKLNQKK